MSTSTVVSIVIPAHNEEGNLPALFEKIARVCERQGILGEIILVNDGSTDRTEEVAEQFKERMRSLNVIRHRRRKGLTQALMTGFENAGGEIVIFLCADLQSDPEEDVPKLLGKLNEGYDMVVGWRQGRREFKRFASKVYYVLSRLLFGVKVHDPNWIKAFRREVVESLNLRSSWHRYIVAIATQEGYRITEVKTTWHPRKSGKSKFGFGRLISAIADLVALKFEMTFLERPLQFFGLLGLVLFVLGFIFDASIILLWDIFASGARVVEEMPKLLFGVLLMIAGLQLFSLGLLGEMLVSLIKRKDK